MKKILPIALSILVIILFQYCNNQNSDKTGNKGDSLNTNKNDATTEALAASSIKPVPLPNPNIPGFNFPEDSNQLNTWIGKNDSARIALHGWGLWTALTSASGEDYNGEPLKVFETWFTPADIASAMTAKEKNNNFSLEKFQGGGRGKLMTPHQFIHAREMKSLNLEAVIRKDDSSRILGFVKFDPSAAAFAISNKLLDGPTLQAMLSKGNTDVPDFPNTAMALKPVFEIITQSSLVNGYFKLNVWSGPPTKPKAYPEGDWPGFIYVDPANKGQGNGSVDTGGKGRTPQTTYNVDDFIHFKLDQQTALELKNTMNISSASAGDIAILVGMHVTSREIRRWTWQTYWWTPDPRTPSFPSSDYIASVRPKQLTGSAAHYAMSIGYTFINPDQPFTGGKNIGQSLYVFNPYLEAGFDPSTFSETAKVITNGKTIINGYGIQTNCMSCHALANYNPNNIPTGPGYIADTYVDMQGARFKNVLKTDFLWSIPGNISTGSTNFALFMKKSTTTKKVKK